MKKKKLPPKPKASASLPTHQKWEERCAIIQTHNNSVDAEESAKKAIASRVKDGKPKGVKTRKKK